MDGAGRISPHQIVRNFIPGVGIVLVLFRLLLAFMEYHHGGFIPFHDLAGHRLRDYLVAVVDEDHRKPAPGELVGHGIVHQDLLDLLAVRKLVVGLAATAVEAVGFHQLADLGADGLALGFLVPLTVQLAVALGLVFPGLLGAQFCLVGLDGALGLLLALLLLFFLVGLVFFLVRKACL